MSTSVLTQHNDSARSGANLHEVKLKVSDIDVNRFGLLCSRAVEGLIYAQPLYVPGVNIGGRATNLVIVARMKNWVYAFDGDDTTPSATFLWRRRVHPHPVPAHVYGSQYNDISGTIGILGTPVADPATQTVYVVAAAFEPAILEGPIATAHQAFKQLLVALDLSTGHVRPPAPGSANPIEIGGAAAGTPSTHKEETKKRGGKTGGTGKGCAPAKTPRAIR